MVTVEKRGLRILQLPSPYSVLNYFKSREMIIEIKFNMHLFFINKSHILKLKNTHPM